MQHFSNLRFQEDLQLSASETNATNSVNQDIVFYQNSNSFVKSGEY